MIRPMFGYRAKAKKFNYKPRYYDPEKQNRGSNRIKIERSYRKTHQGRSVLAYALLLAFVVWLISYL